MTITPVAALDGLIGELVDDGHAEVLARSGPPRGGEPPDGELLLVEYDPDP